MEPRRLLSAGIIPVWRTEEGRWLYLLLRAYGYWDFPKGLVEPGENPWEGALRELGEETGIASAHPRWGFQCHETLPYSRGKIARYYLAEVEASSSAPPVRIAPNPVNGVIEHHEFRWLPYAEARQLLVPRVQAALDWAQGLLKE